MIGKEKNIYSYNFFIKKSNSLNRLNYKLPLESIKKYYTIKQKQKSTKHNKYFLEQIYLYI